MEGYIADRAIVKRKTINKMQAWANRNFWLPALTPEIQTSKFGGPPKFTSVIVFTRAHSPKILILFNFKGHSSLKKFQKQNFARGIFGIPSLHGLIAAVFSTKNGHFGVFSVLV